MVFMLRVRSWLLPVSQMYSTLPSGEKARPLGCLKDARVAVPSFLPLLPGSPASRFIAPVVMLI